jgi:hypothetical protein
MFSIPQLGLHLISYYQIDDKSLRQPSEDPKLASIVIKPELRYFLHPLPAEPDDTGVPHYCYKGDDTLSNTEPEVTVEVPSYGTCEAHRDRLLPDSDYQRSMESLLSPGDDFHSTASESSSAVSTRHPSPPHLPIQGSKGYTSSQSLDDGTSLLWKDQDRVSNSKGKATVPLASGHPQTSQKESEPESSPNLQNRHAIRDHLHFDKEDSDGVSVVSIYQPFEAGEWIEKHESHPIMAEIQDQGIKGPFASMLNYKTEILELFADNPQAALVNDIAKRLSGLSSFPVMVTPMTEDIVNSSA